MKESERLAKENDALVKTIIAQLKGINAIINESIKTIERKANENQNRWSKQCGNY